MLSVISMSIERWAYLWGFLVSGVAAAYLTYVAWDPTQARGGPRLVKALDSWFLSARWSQPAERRLWRMAIVALLLALFMLYGLVVDPPTRYGR